LGGFLAAEWCVLAVENVLYMGSYISSKDIWRWVDGSLQIGGWHLGLCQFAMRDRLVGRILLGHVRVIGCLVGFAGLLVLVGLDSATLPSGQYSA
jgi:hypothetical protein